MVLKINGQVETRLEQVLLEKVESNKQQRPEVFRRLERESLINLLLNYFKT